MRATTSLVRQGTAAIALVAALLLAPAGAPAGAVNGMPPTDCTATPSFTHVVPPPVDPSTSPVEGTGRVAVVAIGGDLHVRVFTADHSTPPTVPVSALECLGGAATGIPAIVADTTRTRVFVQGTDKWIWYKDRVTGGPWSGWTRVGGTTAVEEVDAVMTGNRTDLFYVTPGTIDPPNSVMHVWQVDGGAWSAPERLGGTVQGSVSATRGGDGRFHIWASGTDNRIYVDAGNTGSWTGWHALPSGATTSTPSATVGFEPTGQREDVFVVGTNGLYYQATLTNLGAFTGWAQIPTGPPNVNSLFSAASSGPGRLTLYFSDGGEGLLSRFYDGAWQPLHGGFAPYVNVECLPEPPRHSDLHFCDYLTEAAG